MGLRFKSSLVSDVKFLNKLGSIVSSRLSLIRKISNATSPSKAPYSMTEMLVFFNSNSVQLVNWEKIPSMRSWMGKFFPEISVESIVLDRYGKDQYPLGHCIDTQFHMRLCTLIQKPLQI